MKNTLWGETGSYSPHWTGETVLPKLDFHIFMQILLYQLLTRRKSATFFFLNLLNKTQPIFCQI